MIRGNENFRVHKSLRLVLATRFQVLRKIKLFNDGTNPTARIDNDYHNGFTAILNFPKIEVVLTDISWLLYRPRVGRYVRPIHRLSVGLYVDWYIGRGVRNLDHNPPSVCSLLWECLLMEMDKFRVCMGVQMGFFESGR